jgi:phenylacetate-CoA ligase
LHESSLGERALLRGLSPIRDLLVRRTLRRVAEHSPHYRRRFAELGIDVREVRRVSDLSALGLFTEPEELAADWRAFQTVGDDRVLRTGASSGTTGARKRVALTARDWRWLVRTAARGLRSTGVSRGDACVSLYSSSRPEWFLGDLMAEALALCRVPCRIARSKDPERVLADIRESGATMLVGPPGLVLSITRRAGATSLRELGVRRIHLGAEPFSETTRQELADTWGAAVFDGYGLIELGGAVAAELAPGGGLVVSPFLFTEVVEPASGRPVADGVVGELVFTTLGREGSPLVRYRTRDLAARLEPEAGQPSVLVRTTRILGRVDDMITVGAARNLHPVPLEEIVLAVPSVSSFQLVVDTEDERDVLTFRLECAGGGDVSERVQVRLFAELPVLELDVAAGVIHPLRFERLEPGSLSAETGLKVRRIADRRGSRYPT